jgi:CheY-like chemotaxis protein
MTERIAMRYNVALEGFGVADRLALGRFFSLAGERAPSYDEAAGLPEADFVIANADHAPAVQALADAGRLRDTLFVGDHRPAGAGGSLARPIVPADVLRELDALLEQRLAAFDEPVASDWMMAAADLPVPAAPAGPPAAAGPSTRDVLVVDDSRIALKFLQVRLQGLGYRVHLAQTTDDALRLLSTQPFSLVFLDVVLGPEGSMDGLQLCRHIKQRKSHPGDKVPRVLMVTGLGSSSDRVRGDLAGCDAYLTKPLMEPAFLEALQLLDQPVAAPA